MPMMWKKIKFTDKRMEENNLNLMKIPKSWPGVEIPNTCDTVLEDSKQMQSLQPEDKGTSLTQN
eukprot:13184272-Ditylum_brightwellii.AAC.1